MRINVNNIADSFDPVGVSQLGTVVFDNIVFPAGTYFDLDGNEQFYNEVVLDAVTVTVNRNKEIVRSKVSGRDGEIKEYVTNNDYRVSVNAVIAPENYTADQIAQIAAGFIPGVRFGTSVASAVIPNEPTELINNLAILEKVPDRVEVRCKHLQNNFDINYLVIDDFRLGKATADSYALRIECSSDFSIDLKDFG